MINNDLTRQISSLYTISKKQVQREVKRDSKWIHMIKNWSEYYKIHYNLVKKRIRKGIPRSFRRIIWPLLLNISSIKQQYKHITYTQLLHGNLLHKHDIQIKKDLPRILQRHILFRSPESGSRTIICDGQLSLYNIFKAYAIYDPLVGYVQGMDSLVTPALMFMQEEECFWLLLTLLNNQKHNLRHLYTNGMSLAFEYTFIYDLLLKQQCYKVWKYLKQLHITHISYAFRWLAARYHLFPTPLFLRIMDIYIHEGMKIIYRMAIWIIKYYAKELLQLEDDQVLYFLSNVNKQPIMLQTDYVINQVLKVKIKTKDIIKYQNAYKIQQME